MTLTLVERVARAIITAGHVKVRGVDPENVFDELCDGEFQDQLRLMARAAIEAMREPTRGIVDAAINHGLGDFEGAWRSAIDAALEEKSNVR